MSVVDAKQALYELFAADPSENQSEPVSALTEVTAVYRGEPRAGNLATPIALTIFYTGGDGLDENFNLTLYAKPDRDVMDIQDQFDTTVDQVNEILGTNDTFGRQVHNASYDAALDALICVWQVQYGREDFGGGSF